MYGKAYSNLLISENAFNTVADLKKSLLPFFGGLNQLNVRMKQKFLRLSIRTVLQRIILIRQPVTVMMTSAEIILTKYLRTRSVLKVQLSVRSLFPELMRFLLFFQGCFGTAICSLPFPESHMILWLMR